MLVGRISFTVAIAVFAVAAVANGLDRISERVPALERVVPAPFRAHADRSAAETALTRNDSSWALASARAAVSSDPVDPDATPLLGSALLLANKPSDAEKAFRIAARFGWRNLATQAYWYQAALNAGAMDVAVDRADALLRTHPQRFLTEDLLKPVESDPRGRELWAQRLQENPPWLADYLTIDDDTPDDMVGRRLAVLTTADAERHPLGCDRVASFTRVLLARGRRSDAEALWNNHCPSQKVTGYISDPDFTRTISHRGAGLPFSWESPVSGDVLVTSASSDGKGQGLTLSNTASSTHLALMQSVSFPPGSYRIRLKAAPSQDLSAGKAFVSWGCDNTAPFPSETDGNLLQEGQLIHVARCDRQYLGLWVAEKSSLTVQSIDVEKAEP
jgi:hypothetical protein